MGGLDKAACVSVHTPTRKQILSESPLNVCILVWCWRGVVTLDGRSLTCLSLLLNGAKTENATFHVMISMPHTTVVPFVY
jgi:hypothetical protein